MFSMLKIILLVFDRSDAKPEHSRRSSETFERQRRVPERRDSISGCEAEDAGGGSQGGGDGGGGAGDHRHPKPSSLPLPSTSSRPRRYQQREEEEHRRRPSAGASVSSQFRTRLYSNQRAPTLRHYRHAPYAATAIASRSAPVVLGAGTAAEALGVDPLSMFRPLKVLTFLQIKYSQLLHS